MGRALTMALAAFPGALVTDDIDSFVCALAWHRPL
jgi:hypothetical protein